MNMYSVKDHLELVRPFKIRSVIEASGVVKASFENCTDKIGFMLK